MKIAASVPQTALSALWKGTCTAAIMVFSFGVSIAQGQQSDFASGSGRGPLLEETLGESSAIPITFGTTTGDEICRSFSFSQLPRSPELFVGKLKLATPKGICAGALTLALFRLDWKTHVMTLLKPIIDVPLNDGTRTIQSAYDPYVAEFHEETWVAFECVGPGIAGTSACVAPLVGNDRIDSSRLNIPVVGIDGDPKSPWSYSTSTPKLLTFKGRLFLYWSAIQMDKTPPHRWNNIETRGVEMVVEASGQRRMWAKGYSGRPIPSNAPGTNVKVMALVQDDDYRNTSVDTEGLFVDGDHIIVLSSVGGSGPDGTAPCTKPRDRSPGCCRLEITRTDTPLGEGAFQEQTLVTPKLPANAAEYPRIVTSPDGGTYLMAILHEVQIAAAPNSGKTLSTGYVLIPLHLPSLVFGANGRH